MPRSTAACSGPSSTGILLPAAAPRRRTGQQSCVGHLGAVSRHRQSSHRRTASTPPNIVQASPAVVVYSTYAGTYALAPDRSQRWLRTEHNTGSWPNTTLASNADRLDSRRWHRRSNSNCTLDILAWTSNAFNNVSSSQLYGGLLVLRYAA